jgi:hypothetical protein
MKKNIIYLALIFMIVLILLYIFMPSGILVEPNITPAEYLNSIPYVTIFNRWIIITPLSTIIVYVLGIQIMLIGSLFIKNHQTVWGISLLFWGLGTLLAGTSYQGLGYELKCRDLIFCQFTSWFELSYLFVTAISIAMMAVAFAQEFLNKDHQKYLVRYAKYALIVYTVLLVTGSILENRILISYEIFTVFFMPLFVVFFVINIMNYRKHQDQLNRSFIQLWIWFLIVNVAYYAYYIPGFTESLYENTGLYFSANDVLHIGLMGWFGLMLFSFKKHLFHSLSV